MSGHMDDRVRNGDSEAHPGRAMISAARSSSPRPGPYRRGAAGRPKYGPRLDRTKMLDRNPNTPPDGLVGVIPWHGRRRRRCAEALSPARRRSVALPAGADWSVLGGSRPTSKSCHTGSCPGQGCCRGPKGFRDGKCLATRHAASRRVLGLRLLCRQHRYTKVQCHRARCRFRLEESKVS